MFNTIIYVLNIRENSVDALRDSLGLTERETGPT